MDICRIIIVNASVYFGTDFISNSVSAFVAEFYSLNGYLRIY